MAQIVDRAYMEIDGEVIDCDSIDWTVNGNKDLRTAMNKKNRAIAHKHGVPQIEISCDFAADLDHSTKYWDLLANNTLFSTVVEMEGNSGDTLIATFTSCEVYEVKCSSKDGDSTTFSLSIKALDFQFS